MDTPAEPGKDIQTLFEATPGIVLDDRSTFDRLFAVIKAETAKVPIDLTTDKSRGKLITAARRIASTRAAIETARKAKTADARKLIDAINEAGKTIDTELLAFQTATRKPVTDWEAAEVEREAKVKTIMDHLASEMLLKRGETAADVRARAEALDAWILDQDVLKDKFEDAQKAKGNAIGSLQVAEIDLKYAETQAAELEALRTAQAKRDQEEAARAAETAKVAKAAADAELEKVKAENARLRAQVQAAPAFDADRGHREHYEPVDPRPGQALPGATPINPAILARAEAAIAEDADRQETAAAAKRELEDWPGTNPIAAGMARTAAIMAGAPHSGVVAIEARRALLREAAQDIFGVTDCGFDDAMIIAKAIADGEVRHLGMVEG